MLRTMELIHFLEFNRCLYGVAFEENLRVIHPGRELSSTSKWAFGMS